MAKSINLASLRSGSRRLSKRVLSKIAHRLPISSAVWAKLSLLKTLVRRDLEARYKGSIIGNLWPLVNQLAQLAVYIYVFSFILKVKPHMGGLPDTGFGFGLWLFAGLIPWIAFTSGFAQAATCVIAQPNLVKRVVFPLALLPLVPIFSAFVESSFGWITLITLVALATKTIHATLWLFPLIWIPQLLFTIGLGYLVAALTVFLRDVPQSIGIILNLWFYVTPIIYPASSIPAEFRAWILWCNPIAIIVEIYRDLLLLGELPPWSEWLTVWGSAIVVFLGGLWVYRRLRPAFADVL